MRILRQAAILALTLAGLGPAIQAQLVLGNISGTVLDSQNAAVPGAKVQVKNTDTNLTLSAATQSDGSYQFQNLPIGNYTVTISHDGFKTEHFSAILVQGNRTTTVDGQLTLGTVSESVEVSATPLRNEVDATNGYVLDSRTIQSTPLGTGSFTQLAILAPGMNADFLAGSGSNAGLGNQNIWANGQRDTSNTFTINGVLANNLFNGKSSSQVSEVRYTSGTGQFPVPAGGGESQTNVSVYSAIGQGLPTPAPEVIEELRVNTSQYDSSQGGTAGAQISLLTKSGTNQYHGQLYENFQNSDLNAAPFFRNADPTISAANKVPALHYNRFGATLGGPVKRDKVFFFGAYQGVRESDSLSSIAQDTVPQHLTDDRSPQALSGVLAADFPKDTPVAPANIDPVALKLLNAKIGGRYLIPSATITDPNLAKQLNYNALVQGPATLFRQDQGIGNVDWNFTERDRLSGKFFISRNPNSNPFAQSNTLGFPQSLNADSWVASATNTTIVNPHFTWEQHVGVIRQVVAAQMSQALSPQDIGMSLFGGTAFPALEIFTADNALKHALFIGPRNGNGFANNGVFQNRAEWSSSAHWVSGRHDISFGFSTDYSQLNIINGANQTANVESTDFGGFLAGQISPQFSFLYAGSSNRYYRAWQVGAFVQDNFRLTSNLHVSIGLRYDFNGPFSEKYGRLTSFHPDAYRYDPATDTILNSGIVVAGNNPTLGTRGVSDSTLTGRQWGIGPRLGIAWSPRALPKITFRAGAGIYYDRGEYFTYLSPGAGPNGTGGPFGVTLSLPFVSKVNASSTGTLDVPFGTSPPPPPNNPAAITALLPNIANLSKGATTYVFGGFDPANTLPYAESWSFDIQWQPLNSWLISAGYVGNHGVHQVMPIPFNQPGIATPASPINGQTSSYGYNVVPSETLKTFDTGNTDLRAPYLGYSTSSVFYEGEGVSSYNSLQLGLRKRLSKGFSVTASYTWSHTLDEQSGLGLFFNGNDPTQPKLSYGNSAYDRTHVFIASYAYDVPRWRGAKPWEGAIVNGWQINGVATAQSGNPFNFYDFSGAVAGIYYGQFASTINPVIGFQAGTTVQSLMLQSTTNVNPSKPYIDVSKLSIPFVPPGTAGVPAGDTYETGWSNTGRNIFRGPFQERFDLSAAKLFRINERFTLRYSAEAYNLTNHPSFDVPNLSTKLYSVTSGRTPVINTVQSSSVGIISNTIGSPRFIQMSLRLLF